MKKQKKGESQILFLSESFQTNWKQNIFIRLNKNEAIKAVSLIVYFVPFKKKHIITANIANWTIAILNFDSSICSILFSSFFTTTLLANI